MDGIAALVNFFRQNKRRVLNSIKLRDCVECGETSITSAFIFCLARCKAQRLMICYLSFIFGSVNTYIYVLCPLEFSAGAQIVAIQIGIRRGISTY